MLTYMVGHSQTNSLTKTANKGSLKIVSIFIKDSPFCISFHQDEFDTKFHFVFIFLVWSFKTGITTVNCLNPRNKHFYK